MHKLQQINRFLFSEMRWTLDSITNIIDNQYRNNKLDTKYWSYLMVFETSDGFRVNNIDSTITFAVRQPGETLGHIKCNGFGMIFDAKYYKESDAEIYNSFTDLIGTSIDTVELERIQFVNCNLKTNPKANQKILWFIANFIFHQNNTNNSVDVIINQFRAGYCLHFAMMLKCLFGGEIYWAAPFGHMVYMHDGIPYDIEGVNTSDCEHYIPIKYIEDGIKDFTRVPGDYFNASENFIQECMNNYKKDNNI